MASDIAALVNQLSNIGFYEFILPWLFTFAIVFGLLRVSKVFGDGAMANKISGIIAIVLAFFVTPFAGPWLASFFATLSIEMTVVLGGILTIVIFAAMIGWDRSQLQQKKWGLYAAVILGIVVFLVATGGQFLRFTIGSSLGIILIIIVIIAAIVFVASGEEGGTEAGAGKGGKTP